MKPKPPSPAPVKQDRNPHERSGEEAPPAESHRQLTAGGGHRSGSRGAGTSENSDGRNEPGQGPTGAAAGMHPA